MRDSIISFAKIHVYNIGLLANDPSALYDVHNTGNLGDAAFFVSSKTGLSPANCSIP